MSNEAKPVTPAVVPLRIGMRVRVPVWWTRPNMQRFCGEDNDCEAEVVVINGRQRLRHLRSGADSGPARDNECIEILSEATPAPVAAPMRLLTAWCRECHHKAGENCICGVPEAAPMPSTCPACGWSGKAGHIHRCGGDVWFDEMSEIPPEFDKREQGPSAVAKVTPAEPWTPAVDEWDLLPDAETRWRR